MQPEDQYVETIIISPEVFSGQLNIVYARCGINAKKLAELMQSELNKLLIDDKIPLKFSRNVGVSENVLNEIISGNVLPSREQVILIVLALITWYNSAFLARVCQENGRDVPVFAEQDAMLLFHSAGYASPDDIKQARKMIVQKKKEIDESEFVKKMRGDFQGGSGKTKGKRRIDKTDEPRTDATIQAISYQDHPAIN